MTREIGPRSDSVTSLVDNLLTDHPLIIKDLIANLRKNRDLIDKGKSGEQLRKSFGRLIGLFDNRRVGLLSQATPAEVPLTHETTLKIPVLSLPDVKPPLVTVGKAIEQESEFYKNVAKKMIYDSGNYGLYFPGTSGKAPVIQPSVNEMTSFFDRKDKKRNIQDVDVFNNPICDRVQVKATTTLPVESKSPFSILKDENRNKQPEKKKSKLMDAIDSSDSIDLDLERLVFKRAADLSKMYALLSYEDEEFYPFIKIEDVGGVQVIFIGSATFSRNGKSCAVMSECNGKNINDSELLYYFQSSPVKKYTEAKDKSKRWIKPMGFADKPLFFKFWCNVSGVGDISKDYFKVTKNSVGSLIIYPTTESEYRKNI